MIETLLWSSPVGDVPGRLIFLRRIQVSSSVEVALYFHLLVAQKVQAFYLLTPLLFSTKDLDLEILILGRIKP